jgi:PAS domain S-box-containing protein
MEKPEIKILAIDDNPDNLISLKALIKEAFPGSITLSAVTGAAGLELAQTEEPSVILLDVVMPGMDGFEVCQKLKANPKSRDIPVVFLTALKGDKENRIHALEVGAEAFLAKPIDETELTAQIKAMLKIKTANDQKRNETEHLSQVVAEQTLDLEQTQTATLNLLEELRGENEGRRKNEDALRKSEERYRALFEQAAVGVALVETQTGRFVDVNRKYCDFLGYTKEEMVGLSFMKFTYAEDVQDNVDNMALLLAGKIREYVIEKRYMHKDGSIVWGNLTTSPLWAPGEEPAEHYHTAVVEDITERKRAEEQIRRSETWLRGLVRILQYHPDTTQGFLDNALSEAINLSESKIGYIYFYQEDRKQFVLNTWSKDVMVECTVRDPQTCYELEKTGFWGEAVRQRKPIILNDFQADHPLKKGTPEGHANLTRFMSVPVFNGEQIVAVVGLANKADDYDETDVLQLTLLMDAIWKSVDIQKGEDALRESEEKYKLLHESAGVGIGYYATNGVVISFNAMAAMNMGGKPEDFNGKSIYELFPKMAADSYMERILKAAASDEMHEYEDKVDLPGEQKWFFSVFTRILNSSNAVVGVQIISTDISRRKLAEEALRESEERYREIFDSSNDGLFIQDIASGSILDVNKKMMEMYGYADEREAQNWTKTDLSALEEWYTEEKITKMDQSAIDSNSNSFEWHAKKRNGEKFWAQVFLQRTQIGGENRILTSIHDITERRLAEDALRESEERFRQLFQSMESGFALHEIICDATGVPCDYRFLEINPAFEKLTGLKAGALIGHTVMEALPGTEKEWVERYGKVALTGEAANFENFSRELGQYFQVTAYSPEHGQFAVIIQDVTAVKQAEEEKRQLYEQLIQSQKMESVGRLAGGVAHDFNNLLGVIIGRAETALAKISPQQPLYRDLHEILKAGERSADLTRQLLAFARKQPMSPIVLNLNNAVSSIFEMLRRLIGEDIELIWKPHPALWHVRVDSSQVDQVLTNLLVNARDAIEGMGKVVIETSNIVCDAAACANNPGMNAGDFAVLSVSDNGTGMDQETRSHLFEPFFTTKEIGKGTGLGLSTVFGIVKQNNGYIKVSSEPGQGTTFKIYLPRVEDELAPTVLSAAVKTPRGAAEMILIVEDEEALLDMVQETLEDKGYNILAAGTPDEALRLAKEHAGQIHLLITDVIMPGMNGKVLAEQLRAFLPGLKCLFMSGYTADIITNRGVMPDGIHFIQKPFSLENLAAKVREVLG